MIQRNLHLLATVALLGSTSGASAQQAPTYLRCTYTGQLATYQNYKETNRVSLPEQTKVYRFAEEDVSYMSQGDDDWHVEACSGGCISNQNVLSRAWDFTEDRVLNANGMTLETRYSGKLSISRITGKLEYVNTKTSEAGKFVVHGVTRERQVLVGMYNEEQWSGTCSAAADPFAGKARKF